MDCKSIIEKIKEICGIETIIDEKIAQVLLVLSDNRRRKYKKLLKAIDDSHCSYEGRLYEAMIDIIDSEGDEKWKVHTLLYFIAGEDFNRKNLILAILLDDEDLQDYFQNLVTIQTCINNLGAWGIVNLMPPLE